MADPLTTPELLTDHMLYDVMPLMTRALRRCAQQVDAGLYVGPDCALEITDAVREAAGELLTALVRNEARALGRRPRLAPESVEDMLWRLDAGALSLRGP